MSPDDEVTKQADALRLARVERIIDTNTTKDRKSLRILDLACRVGAFAVPLAKSGASVLGIEGRADNAQYITPTPRLKVVVDDVRNMRQHAGDKKFDVTLCLGLFYHLDADSAFKLLQDMREVTEDFVILDTHVSVHPVDVVTINNELYVGHMYQDVDAPWGSLGNDQSWWFSASALTDLVKQAGFARMKYVDGPAHPWESTDRRWAVLYV